MSLFKADKKPKTPPATAPTAEPPQPVPAAVSAPTVQARTNPVILKKPWISEKALLLGGANNQYVFAVDSDATKPAVREAVERRYGVHVVQMNVVRLTGKQRHFRGVPGRRLVRKKAIVKLRKGEKIDVQ